MKSLKKEIRRLLSLFVVAAMILVSVPQEYLTVRAAEISEDGTKPGASEKIGGEVKTKETEVPEEENGQPASEPSETDPGQDQPVTESSETDPEQSQPETGPSGADPEQSQPTTEPSETEKTEGTDAAQTPGTEESGATEGETAPETPAEDDGTVPADPDGTDGAEGTDSEITAEEGETEETETLETETSETETDGTKKADDEEESAAEKSKNVRAVGTGGVPEFDDSQIVASGYGYTASGSENKNVTWKIDGNGTLEVTGEGEICRSNTEYRPPWHYKKIGDYNTEITYEFTDKIKAARINLKGATYATNLFAYCYNLTNIDLSGFDTSKVTNMHGMFDDCWSLTSSELNPWLAQFNTENVTNMGDMFWGCSALTKLQLENFNTSEVTDMSRMFLNCSALTELQLGNFDTSKVTNMNSMFSSCSTLTELQLDNFNTSKVTNMKSMFSSCGALTELQLNHFDTSNVTDMESMFSSCSSLTSLDLSGWSTDSLSHITYMFLGCSALKSLDLSGFNLDNVTKDYTNWLTSLYALDSIVCPANLTKGGVMLPSRDGISWRRLDGTKTTVLVTNSSEPVAISRDQMAGIEFQGKNFTLKDAEGNPISLTSIGEKVVKLGDTESFTFTVVPDPDHIMTNMELASDGESTLVLEKGTQPNQYTLSPRDKENGYTRDEIVKVEIIPVAEIRLSVTYDKNIVDTIVRNGTIEQKEKPETVQLPNNKETSLYVKFDNTGSSDPQEPVIYLTSDNQQRRLVTRCQDTADLSDAEKALIGQGYDIFRLGCLYEDTTAHVTSRYSTSEDEIASGKDGDINWVIDANGRLKIKGVGDLAYTYMNRPAWYEYREQIKTAVVEWTKATDARYIFNECINLEEVDVSGFDISGLTGLSNLFYGCQNLKSLDLSGWDFKDITSISNMFSGCTSLTEIKTPRNVTRSVPLPNAVGSKWRLPDDTVITELPQNKADSITIDTHRAAITFYGDNITVKDADGKKIESELLVINGTKEPVTFTVETPEGYVVGRVSADSYEPSITVSAGAVPGQYIISPQNMENGYTKDESVRIETTTVQTYTMNVNYSNGEKIADVIIVNGDVSKEGRPTNMAVSNAYNTNMYLKVGKMEEPGTWIPKISVYALREDGSYYDKTLSQENNTDSMSAREKELSQQGYYIFHLGRLLSDTNTTVELTTFYQAQITTEGFPGNVRIVRYVNDGYDSYNTRKWLKEEIKDSILVESGVDFYLQAEWEDTPDQANKWCRTAVLAKPDAHVNTTTLDGVEGEVQRMYIYNDTAIQFSLKPHKIALDYSFGDLVDISAGSGAKLSEDQHALEIYSGDNVSFSFGLSSGLQLGEAIDNTGVRWPAQESGGRYTVTFSDMTTLYNITGITVSVSDPLNRTALYDPEANCQVTGVHFKNTRGNSPTYTGEPIEAERMSVSAFAKNYNNGQKPRQMKLQKDTDYTVSYVNNINAGNAQMIITAVPDSQYFRGSYVYPFTITKAESPKGLYQTIQVENVGGQYTHQVNLSELFQITLADGKQLIPTGYKLATPCDKGEVLVQNAEPVLEGNILTYTIREDAGKNSLLAHLSVTAMFDNYQDCELQINIRVVKKQKLVLGGTVTIADKEYDGKEVSPNAEGLQILSVEGTDGPASAELVNEIKNTLSYHYTGMDGTLYDSDVPPIEIGTYKAQVKISEENLDYKSDCMDIGNFRITQRNVRVIADDVKLYLDDTMPTQYTYHTEGMAEGDAISTNSFVSCGIQNTAVLAEYPVIVNASAVKIANPSGKDVTANYIITGQEGKLTVCEPEPGSYTVLYTGIDPLDPLNPQKYIKRSGNEAGKQIEKPSDPTANGYVFLGWFIDELSTREWNFDTDIIQGDLTLYAGWSKPASESVGMALCVQEIMPQTYTGKAIKPMVTVYAADGKTRLRPKKDYTITYKNNINSDTKAFPNETPPGGIGETLNDTAQGFNSSLPYVIIKGKGNYAGTAYVNFHIRPANIAASSGYTLKYTDQFEEKPGKYAAIVTQFKYKNKKLVYNRDYTITVQKTDGDAAAVTLNAKGQLPLTKGTYKAVIAGKDNFTGEIEITEKDLIFVADKAQLFKNAKVTCKQTVSGVTKEKLEAGVQPEDLVVKMNGIELPGADYTVACTGNHAIGTATVTIRPKEGSGYIGSKSVTFKIKGAAFKEKAVSMSGWQDVMPYIGKALTQNGVVLTANGENLVYGTDYTVSYKNNMKKGNATMVFTANPSSGYSGSFSKKFKITPMDLAVAVNEGTIAVNGAEKIGSGWKLPGSVSYQKGGAVPADEVSLQLMTADTLLKTGKGGDYTVKYTNNKNVSNGSAYMTLKGTGNFTGSIDIYFDITKASLPRLYEEGRAAITSAAIRVPYTHRRYYEDYGDGEGEWLEGDLVSPDSVFKPAITIKDGKTALKKNVDFTVEYSGNTRGELEDSNVLSATIRGIGNYGGDEEEIVLSVGVNRTTLSAARVEVSYEKECTYTGEPIMPEVGEVSYKISNGYGREDDEDYEPPEWATLTQGADYRVEYAKNIAKGKGTIKIIGIGGFTGSVSKSFSINSRKIYNGSQQSGGSEEDE